MKYDYKCLRCKKPFEVEVVTTSLMESRRRISPKCPKCKSRNVIKLIVAPKIHLNNRERLKGTK